MTSEQEKRLKDYNNFLKGVLSTYKEQDYKLTITSNGGELSVTFGIKQETVAEALCFSFKHELKQHTTTHNVTLNL